jgi:hypothetical protein
MTADHPGPYPPREIRAERVHMLPSCQVNAVRMRDALATMALQPDRRTRPRLDPIFHNTYHIAYYLLTLDTIT